MNSNLFGGFEDEPQIDLTPLIDCLFMLIIFFVLTMSFSKPVLEVVLPQAVNGDASHDRNELLVSVKADGVLFLNADRRRSKKSARRSTRSPSGFSTSTWMKRRLLRALSP